MYPPSLGKGLATKSDEFLKSAKGVGGSFSIQKFILQILGLETGLFVHEIDSKE